MLTLTKLMICHIQVNSYEFCKKKFVKLHEICIFHILFFPDDREMVLLLATVIVHARPKHLLSTLNYADLFAWAVPSDMM